MKASPRSLSVLVATLRYPPYVAGGYELQTSDAVQGLRARGHRVTVLSARGHELEGTRDVLPWLDPTLDGEEDLFEHSYRASNAERFRLHFLRLSNLRATRRALEVARADVLLFFNLALVSLAPVLAARLRGTPTLGYVGDGWPRNHWLESWRADEVARTRKAVTLDWLERGWHAFRGTLGLGPLLACSQWLCERLVDDGIPRGDVACLYPGLPPDMRVGPAPRPRAPDEPLRIVCASSLWEGKGQDLLLEAVARASAGGARLEAAILGGGRGDFRARLEALARQHDLGQQVRFTGFVPRDEVERELVRAHVMVVPSRWEEPFGLVTLEGMAKGLAPVVSDSGASPEIVRDGRDGRVFPRGDAQALARVLAELAADEPQRLALARTASQQVAARFSQEVFLDTLEARLLRLCPGARP